jgi:hypothetical protein
VLVHAQKKHVFLHCFVGYVVYPEGETSIISYFENKCKGTFLSLNRMMWVGD